MFRVPQRRCTSVVGSLNRSLKMRPDVFAPVVGIHTTTCWHTHHNMLLVSVQATKDLLQKKFATGKNRWFFQKLRF